MGAEGVDLAEFADANARRGVVLASESVLFITLEVAEALRAHPVSIEPHAIVLTGDGAVELDGGRGKRDEAAAVTSIAAVCQLLTDSPTATMRAFIDRARRGDITRVEGACDELEALLVPLNRAAARRVVGRFVRDHQKFVDRDDAARSEGKHSRVAPVQKDAIAPPARDHGDALDTSPERSEPVRIEPLAGAARPGQSAVDTEPDAGAGLSAMLAHPISTPSGEDRLSNPSLLDPSIPPPPRLGSLHDIAPPMRHDDADSADRSQRISPRTANDARDTVADGGRVMSAPRRNGATVVLAIAILSLAVALVVLAFAMMKR